MSQAISRRDFFATLAAAVLPAMVRSASPGPKRLVAGTRVLEVNGAHQSVGVCAGIFRVRDQPVDRPPLDLIGRPRPMISGQPRARARGRPKRGRRVPL